MNGLFSVNRISVIALSLALAQCACNFGAQPLASQAPQPPSGGLPGTQGSPGSTSKFGTAEQAKAMLQKAVEHYNSVGRTQALSDFTHRAAPFFDRDLYVACIDAQLKISANGGFPNLVGTSTEPLSRAAWDAASSNKIGSVDYSYTDPATGTTEPKTFYYTKVGSDVCGVGAYHPQ